MSVHTPAPWHQAPAPDESGIDISGGDSVIATAWSGLDPDDAVMHANARLICAAPTMLDALRELRVLVEECEDGPVGTCLQHHRRRDRER